MGVRRVYDRFERNREQVKRLALARLQIVMANLDHLKKADPKGTKLRATLDLVDILERGEELTPGQLSYVDGIYEAMMKGAGHVHVSVHSDKKPKSLRY